MLFSRFLLAAPLLAAMAPLTTAGILTVGPAGSGAQFTQIQAAINAAVEDDVILVKPGNYQGITVQKPVRILADGTGSVTVVSAVIRDIAAGKELVLSGASFSATFLSPIVTVSNCAGTVVLEDVLIGGTSTIPSTGPGTTGVQIDGCQRALLTGSIVHAGVDGLSRTGAIVAQNSELWIDNTEVVGVGDECCFATRAPHGIEAVNCTVHVWRSRIRGGDAGAKQDGTVADGGTAIRAVGSTLNLFGGPTSEVAGGRGYEESIFGDQSYPGGPGLDLGQNSKARIQDDIPVRGGLDGAGLVQTAGIVADGTSTFTLDPKVFPTLVSSGQQVQLGTSFDLTLTGNPGGYQVLVLSLRTGPTTIFRFADGVSLLDRASMVNSGSVVLPPSGAFSFHFNVPNNVALLGSTLFFQAAEKLPNASILRSSGSVSTVKKFAIGNPVLVTITR